MALLIESHRRLQTVTSLLLVWANAQEEWEFGLMENPREGKLAVSEEESAALWERLCGAEEDLKAFMTQHLGWRSTLEERLNHCRTLKNLLESP